MKNVTNDTAVSEGDVFGWIDMEEYTTTDVRTDACEELADMPGAVGVCIQASSKRTAEDLQRLATTPR